MATEIHFEGITDNFYVQAIYKVKIMYMN